MPAWVCPVPIVEHENFGGSARVDGTFPLHFCFNDISAIQDRHVAKTLNLRAWKLEPRHFAALHLKVDCGLQHLGLVLPLGLAGADDNGPRGHQVSERLRIVGKPGSPDCLSHFEELPALIATTKQRFPLAEVSADKAYLSRANLDAIEAAGAVPYIPFKSNSKGEGPAAWRRLWAENANRFETVRARIL